MTGETEILIDQLAAYLPRVRELKSKKKLKADNSYVSEGDMLVDSIIKKILSPRGNIVSEEGVIDNGSDTNYVVDPIDGTENFINGSPIWGISIAKYTGDNLIDALIWCPDMRLFSTLGDNAVKTDSRIIGVSSSFSSLTREGKEYRITGCCVYNILAVIKGHFKSFIHPGANAWDILAGINIANAAGLKVYIDEKRYNGEYLTTDKKYAVRIES